MRKSPKTGARNTRPELWVTCALLAVSLAAFGSLAACGGGTSGAGPDGSGQGLVLVSFSHDAVDNVSLNSKLQWTFSEAVDPDSVTVSALQVREGDEFGRGAVGTFRVEGATVIFEPKLPTLCDLSDAGLRPDTQYRVQLVGYPEEFALRNTRGQPLRTTSTYEFHTLPDTDPERFLDQIPAFGPEVVASDSSPKNADQALTVNSANQVILRITENLDPCTVSDATVLFHIYETGNPDLNAAITAANGNASGFYSGSSTTDADPSSFSWGADVSTTWSPPQRVLANIQLSQNFATTDLIITPQAGVFPENALLVVQLTSGIQDFGAQPMVPFVLAFTTQNLPMQSSVYEMRVEGETAFDDKNSTSDINTARSPGLVQGFLLFAGDGDNGADQLLPSGPALSPACLAAIQPNNGSKDDFKPLNDVVFNTGSTPNTCANSADGSTAVVYEFASFHIASGVTVRVEGVNPFLLLVQGDVLIENGGRLLVRGDGQQGTPNSRGVTGYGWTSGSTIVRTGGEGVAGGGDGGTTTRFLMGDSGKPGFSAFGSTDGLNVLAGQGSGEGGTAHTTIYPTSPGTAQGGGGGSHGGKATDALNVLGNAHTNLGPVRGKGGDIYPLVDSMRVPSAGAGGGAGGNEEWGANYQGIYSTGGGSGGAGGGFVDITSSGNVTILGAIDAAGSNGGSGGSSNYQAGPGGGGGGAGGGIRILTSGEIILGSTAVLTAAGGSGGTSPNGAGGGGGPQNHGTSGGNGRIVLEDADSVIQGLGNAAVTPGEGSDGFFRSTFDPSRFQGGGTMPFAQTELISMGPLNPDFTAPVATDFVAGMPSITSLGFGRTGIFIEARGFQVLSDGTADVNAPSQWYTVGYFRDSGIEALPTWVGGQNPTDGATVPPDNAGGTIDSLDGYEYVQLRFTFYLPDTVGPFDPGAFVDDWTIRFTHDQ